MNLKPKYQLTILISGSGTNLRAIIDAVESGELLGVQINKVIADRKCSGIERALKHNIPFEIVNRKTADFKNQLLNAVPAKSDLIVLAGFLSIIPTELVARFPKKIINLHPALLPKYGGKGMYGKHVHEAVLASNDHESGCTVHYVDAGIDTGEIIAQAAVPILPDDNPQTLQKRIQVEEHKLLVKVLADLALQV